MVRNLAIIFLSLFFAQSFSQTGYFDAPIDEFILRGRIKQVEEFMGRFNLEEEWDGTDFDCSHDMDYRRKHLMTLFDRDVFFPNGKSDDVVSDFVSDILQHNYSIHYEDSTWTAVLSCSMLLNRKAQNMTLYLQTYKKAPNEFLWVIKDIDGTLPNVKNIPILKPISSRVFISPVEHEVGFIGILNKVYRGANLDGMFLPEVSQQPSQCLLHKKLQNFALLLNTGQLRFRNITNVRYVFKNIPGWKFTVSRKEKNKTSNTGWLIRKLSKLKE